MAGKTSLVHVTPCTARTSWESSFGHVSEPFPSDDPSSILKGATDTYWEELSLVSNFTTGRNGVHAARGVRIIRSLIRLASRRSAYLCVLSLRRLSSLKIDTMNAHTVKCTGKGGGGTLRDSAPGQVKSEKSVRDSVSSETPCHEVDHAHVAYAPGFEFEGRYPVRPHVRLAYRWESRKTIAHEALGRRIQVPKDARSQINRYSVLVTINAHADVRGSARGRKSSFQGLLPRAELYNSNNSRTWRLPHSSST